MIHDKYNIIKGFVVSTCVLLMFLTLSWLGERVKLLSPWKQAIESYKISDLYFWAHRTDRKVTYNNSSVITIDISSCHDRNEIAALLNKIGSANPAAVAIDVVFPDISSNVDKSYDDSLVNALKRIPNLIVAQEYRTVTAGEYVLNSSFFIDEVQPHVGATSLSTGIIREWTPLLVFNNDTVPSFSKVIADVAGFPMPSGTKPFYIDYSIHDNIVLRADEQWDPDFLKGQIVLIGDLADFRDTHIIPLTLNTSIRYPGVLVHRQILQTAMEGRNIRKVPSWIMFLLSFIFLWVMYVVKSVFKRRDSNEPHPSQRHKGRFILYATAFLQSIKQDAIRLGLMCALICVGYILFWTTGLLFEFKLLVAGYILLYVFEDIDNRLDQLKSDVDNTLEAENIQEIK